MNEKNNNKCPECGTFLKKIDLLCPTCGARPKDLPMEEHKCGHCGKIIPTKKIDPDKPDRQSENTKIISHCPYCGTNY
jgi:DNA-directed RNA polymerase subunit RPC12/RpoP